MAFPTFGTVGGPNSGEGKYRNDEIQCRNAGKRGPILLSISALQHRVPPSYPFRITLAFFGVLFLLQLLKQYPISFSVTRLVFRMTMYRRPSTILKKIKLICKNQIVPSVSYLNFQHVHHCLSIHLWMILYIKPIRPI